VERAPGLALEVPQETRVDGAPRASTCQPQATTPSRTVSVVVLASTHWHMEQAVRRRACFVWQESTRQAQATMLNWTVWIAALASTLQRRGLQGRVYARSVLAESMRHHQSTTPSRTVRCVQLANTLHWLAQPRIAVKIAGWEQHRQRAVTPRVTVPACARQARRANSEVARIVQQVNTKLRQDPRRAQHAQPTRTVQQVAPIACVLQGTAGLMVDHARVVQQEATKVRRDRLSAAAVPPESTQL
jgi:hypothetical protein